MAKKHHIDQLKKTIKKFDPSGANRYFLFGSSVREKNFHDLDIAVVGNKRSGKNLGELRDEFYGSNIPYRVDVVDFDEADESFQKYVMDNEPIVWIQ